MKLQALALCVGGALLVVTVSAQQKADEQTRQIFPEEFLKARPAAAKPAATPPPQPRYKAAEPAAKSPAAATVDVGVTLWRLRAPSGPGDAGARLLVQEGGGELTAERIDTGTALTIGDRLRLTVESPRAGSLYVVDREVYSDGTMSDPYLIFPTSRTRQGDNAVRGGRLVDIPDERDRPNYFTVKPSRPGQTGELLTIIVSAEPLKDVPPLSAQAVKLPATLIESWQKQWTAPVQRLVQEGGKRTWTPEEQRAAADPSRLLTQDDPAPQTIFRVAARKGAPLLVNVKLPYAASDR